MVDSESLLHNKVFVLKTNFFATIAITLTNVPIKNKILVNTSSEYFQPHIQNIKELQWRLLEKQFKTKFALFFGKK